MLTRKVGYYLVATALGGLLLCRATPEVVARPLISTGAVAAPSAVAARYWSVAGKYATGVAKGAFTGAAAGAARALAGTPACPEAAAVGAVVGGVAGAAAFAWDALFGTIRDVTYPADSLDGPVFRAGN